MNQIQFSEETMQRVLTQAILEGVGEEERVSIIGQAVAWLMAPKKDGYGRASETPLQNAFNIAMGSYVHAVVREFIEKDEAVKARVNEELTKLLGQFGEKLHDDYELRNVVTEAVIGYYANKRSDY